ncbi:hypothetical protein [Streptomyces mirabilis]|uniref:hypothetical protein n=1 Tax=Streptomyces mirabilis TaxID=68239 RepID=UPI003685D5F7
MTDTGPTEEQTPDGLLGWCLVANVARETAHGESGLDIQHGTKHFRTGAHTYRMLRNDHGAYEALDNALSVLRNLGLIVVRRAGRVSDERVRRRDYFLLLPAGFLAVGRVPPGWRSVDRGCPGW